VDKIVGDVECGEAECMTVVDKNGTPAMVIK
jgi:hypothetical protein